MKLSQCVMSFVQHEGKPALDFSIPGTDFGVLYYLGELDGEYGITDTERPVQPEDEDVAMPPELEMIYGQVAIYSGAMAHYFSCDKHRSLVRVELAAMHTSIEKAKVNMPHLSEMLISGHLISLVNDIPYEMVARLGLTAGKIVTEPNEYEKKVLAAKKVAPGLDPLKAMPPSKVTLDYAPVVPAITMDEIAAFELAQRKDVPNTVH